ncbi:MAG: hypothetical protein ACQESP_12525, partial [Candidatus Muiribacteriota bacterium]
MDTNDTLSENDLEQFYRLKHTLYLFANQRINVLDNCKDYKDVGNNPLEKIVKVRDYVFEKNRRIIDEFLSAQ